MSNKPNEKLPPTTDGHNIAVERASREGVKFLWQYDWKTFDAQSFVDGLHAATSFSIAQYHQTFSECGKRITTTNIDHFAKKLDGIPLFYSGKHRDRFHAILGVYLITPAWLPAIVADIHDARTYNPLWHDRLLTRVRDENATRNDTKALDTYLATFAPRRTKSELSALSKMGLAEILSRHLPLPRDTDDEKAQTAKRITAKKICRFFDVALPDVVAHLLPALKERDSMPEHKIKCAQAAAVSESFGLSTPDAYLCHTRERSTDWQMAWHL